MKTICGVLALITIIGINGLPIILSLMYTWKWCFLYLFALIGIVSILSYMELDSKVKKED
jgi:hypothetical protein